MLILSTALLLILGLEVPPASGAGSPAGPAQAPTLAAAAARDVPGRTLHLFLDGSSVGKIWVQGDGPNDVGVRYNGGAGGDLLWAPARALRIGFGARYELAYGPAAGYLLSTTNHFVYVPFLIGGVIPLGGSGELDLLLGIGVMAGLIEGGGATYGGETVAVVGPAVELGISYARPIARSIDLMVGVAARVAVFQTVFTSTNNGLKALVPLQIGLRWGV